MDIEKLLTQNLGIDKDRPIIFCDQWTALTITWKLLKRLPNQQMFESYIIINRYLDTNILRLMAENCTNTELMDDLTAIHKLLYVLLVDAELFLIKYEIKLREVCENGTTTE
jgi:hypothetical protein